MPLLTSANLSAQLVLGNTCWHFSAGVEEKDFFASHGTTYLHLTSLT